MSDFTFYRQCPVCMSAAIEKEFVCKDHTVSKYVFEIWKCSSCTLRFTQNVPNEGAIGNYYTSANYISHTDTSEGLINNLYHKVRTITLRSKKAMVIKQSGVTMGKLLDAGAGTGSFAHTMQTAGWDVAGIEPDESARQKALEKYDLTLLPQPELNKLERGVFDAITLWHVLEHVHDLHGYIDTFYKLLKPTGVLIVAVPNYTGYDSKIYKNAWAAYDVPRHLFHFSPKSIEVLMKTHGFQVKTIKPMWFDSFYVSMLSEKHFVKNGSMLRAFKVGAATTLQTIKDVKKSSSLVYIIEKKP